MKLKHILTVLYFITTTYAFGGGVMQGVINYPAWKMIRAEEFPAFHQSMDRRILAFFVPIFLLSVPISLLMIWFRHPAISRKLILVAALSNLIIFLVTITWEIPIQGQLAQAKSAELIDRLIFYDRYLRLIPGLVVLIVNVVMLHQLVRKASA